MKLRTIVSCALVALLVAPAARAQNPPIDWHSYVERLGPKALVVVRLNTGVSVEGRVVQVSDVAVSVLPKTRIPVPVRTLALADIQSIDVRKEGMSAGAKVLSGVGSAAGVLVVLAIVALAGSR